VHSTTTFTRIVELYDASVQLLAKDDFLTEAEQQRFADIRNELDQLWTHRRAELVFQINGPPRLISAPDDGARKRHIAHGIAPLPSGRR
jgi:hypothetical protein